MGRLSYLNEIVLGDSLEVYRAIPDHSVDLIITDPPYELNNGGTGKTHVKMSLTKLSEGLRDIENGWDHLRHMGEWRRIMKKFHAFVFCSNSQVSKIMQWGEERKYVTTLLVWNKTNPAPFANGVWRQDAEFVIHIREKGATFQGDADLKRKVWQSPTVVSKWGHPTEKPVELIARYLQIGSNPSDVVLDPFAGSGTTAMACLAFDRQFICIEKNEEYHAAASRRVREYNDGNLFKYQTATIQAKLPWEE